MLTEGNLQTTNSRFLTNKMIYRSGGMRYI